MKVDQHSIGIKKYTPSFEYTKQMAKEKFGKATNRVDSQDTKMLKDKISHIKHTLQEVKNSGQEYIDHMSVLAEKGAAFSDALLSLGRESLSESMLGSTISMVGDMVKNHSVSTRASSMSTSSQVVSPLTKIYEEELQNIITLKHDQEHIRVQYDAQQHRLRKDSKRGSKRLPHVDQEYMAIKESYEKATKELSDRCDTLIAQMEQALMPSLQAYISFQAAFFTNLSEQWKRMEKTMASNAHMATLDQSNGAGGERCFSPSRSGGNGAGADFGGAGASFSAYNNDDDSHAWRHGLTRSRSLSTPPSAAGGVARM